MSPDAATTARRRHHDAALKRAFDLCASLILLVLASPLLAILAVLVAARLGRPILFRQLRPGRDGVVFELLKFRTMTDERDGHGRLLSDAERLTPFGRWLRSLSLDELPSLLNVVRGEMSLVGPRPLLPSYLPLYSARQARRHEVRPGVTGWAQVNGRNAITWEEKFELDVWYVDNGSFALDLRILLLTAWKVVRRSGISHDGEATMPLFVGTPETTGGGVRAERDRATARGESERDLGSAVAHDRGSGEARS